MSVTSIPVSKAAPCGISSLTNSTTSWISAGVTAAPAATPSSSEEGEDAVAVGGVATDVDVAFAAAAGGVTLGAVVNMVGLGTPAGFGCCCCEDDGDVEMGSGATDCSLRRGIASDADADDADDAAELAGAGATGLSLEAIEGSGASFFPSSGAGGLRSGCC